MKKQAFTAAFISVLLFAALAMTLFVDFTVANFVPEPAEPRFSVSSPQINRVYNTTSIPLLFFLYPGNGTFQTAHYHLLSVRYQLDGILREQLTGDDLPREHYFELTGLSEGKHRVDVAATFVDYYSERTINEGVYFYVDTVAPTIGFLQEEKAYGSANISLNLTLSETVSWVGYSLDGEEAVSVTDTAVMTRRLGRYEYCIVLSGLSEGSHSLTVHAKDAAGNIGDSEPFHFSVATEAQPETEQTASEQPFPTTSVAVASGASLAAIATVLIVYFKKRNHAQTPDKIQ